jgi:uncharacterized protein (DUF305 family)
MENSGATRRAVIVGAAVAAAGPALSQAANPHAGHGAPTARRAPASPSTAAFQAANDKMHRDMAITFSGNADIDFVRGMIPHHQGAIDMAEVVLQHGRDETTKKWAGDIIREQRREIAEMQAWLAQNAR